MGSRLTLGTAQIGMEYGVANTSGKLSDAAALEILTFALESGIRSFDTAPSYGDAEIRLGAALKASGGGESVAITTKLPPIRAAGITRRELSSWVESTVERSLSRLGVDRVAYLLVHDCADLRTYGAELQAALEHQVRSGKVNRVGASVYAPGDAELVLGFPLMSSIQLPLNLLDTRFFATGVLGELEERSYHVFARSPFLQGLLTIAPTALPDRLAFARPHLEALEAALQPLGLRPSEAALPFVAALPGVASIVVGAETPEQLARSIALVESEVPASLVDVVVGSVGDIDERVIDPRRWPVE